MGLVAKTLRPLVGAASGAGLPAVIPFPARATLPSNYVAYARDGYERNEIVFTAIDTRASSAAEPRMIGKRRVRDAQKQAFKQALMNRGASPLQANYYAAKLDQNVTDHPGVRLLNHPNPFMDRFRFWSTVIMHRDIGGNAYALKVRGAGNKPEELWLLRPDRVKVKPGRGFIDSYIYTLPGIQTVEFPYEDIIHWKTRHALDDYYGASPIMSIVGRVNTDNHMRDFVEAFFLHGGNPGAVLAVKQKLTQDAKDEIRSKFRSQFGGPAGWFELLILDQAEASYNPMTVSLGARGLVVPELNAISEARLAMPFGVPLSILGGLTGQESSSYANKRQDWQVFWDLTLGPLYTDLAAATTLSLGPDFTDIDEFQFDLSDVKALQEDVDKLHARHRLDFQAGITTDEEARYALGWAPVPESGNLFVPRGVTPTPIGTMGDTPAVTPPVPEEVTALALWRALGLGRPAEPLEIAAPEVIDVVYHSCGKKVATEVEGNPKLHCWRCKVNFRPKELVG